MNYEIYWQFKKIVVGTLKPCRCMYDTPKRTDGSIFFRYPDDGVKRALYSRGGSCSAEGLVGSLIAQLDVSVIIVNWNGIDLIEQCLRSIESEAGGISIETIVVDNASADASPDQVAAGFPRVKLIRNDTNLGFATANNRGMEIAVGRYILLLNPDTLILDRAIEKSIAFMDQNPTVGIATCKVLNPDRTFQVCFGKRFPGLWQLLTGGDSLRAAFGSLIHSSKYRQTAGMTERDINTSHEVAWAMGAYFLIRREVIEQIGGLDEKLFIYGEEPDYCYRARKNGWRVWYANVGEIVHCGGQSIGKVSLRNQIDWLMSNYFHFFRKHRGRLYSLGCYVLGLVGAVCKTLVFAIVALLPTNAEKRGKCRNKLQQHWLTVCWYANWYIRCLQHRSGQRDDLRGLH